MRIGIDCRTMLDPGVGEGAGVGQYTLQLVYHLVIQYPQDQFVLFFTDRISAHPLMQAIQTYPNVECVRFPFARAKKFLPLIYSHSIVARVIAKQRLDLFHGPAYSIPLCYRGISVVTVHDLEIYAHPEWFPKQSFFSQRILLPRSIRSAKKVITVSKATAQRVQEVFHLPADRIAVTYEAANTPERLSQEVVSAAKEKFDIETPYIFFVGTIEPRKNLVRFVRAFDQFLTDHPEIDDLHFVVAGAKGWKYDEIFHAVAWARHHDRIRTIGYVSEEEKYALMQGAVCFVFPSLAEGFGLPVLEAQRMGTPVLTSNVSSLPEIAGDCAVYVQPEDAASIIRGIETLIVQDAVREDLARRGQEHARAFSWERCAKETYAVYREVV